MGDRPLHRMAIRRETKVAFLLPLSPSCTSSIALPVMERPEMEMVGLRDICFPSLGTFGRARHAW